MIEKRIKQLREESSLSQKELSKIIGVSQQTIGSWEVGRTSPDPILIGKLADYFDVSVDFLLGRTDQRKPCSSTELTKKDKKEIDEYIKSLEEDAEGLMFDGVPISEEDKQLLLEQIERTAELIKLRNKEKYTPKKYKKK